MGDENKTITGLDTEAESEQKTLKTTEAEVKSEESQGQTENVGQTTSNADGIVTQKKAPENRCPKCQALIPEGQAFCHECGTLIKRLCPNCKSEIKNGYTFCSNCGCQITDNMIRPNVPTFDQYNREQAASNTKKTKTKTILIVVAIAVVVILIVSYFSYQKHVESEYIKNAKTFCTTTLSAAANLEEIGNSVKEEWYSYVQNSRRSKYSSVDDAVEGGLSKKSTEVSNAKKSKTEIDSLYSKLKKGVGKSDEIAEIREAVGDLYYEYCDMYDCVVSPTGNYNSFTSELKSVDDSTVSAYKKLSDLLD